MAAIVAAGGLTALVRLLSHRSSGVRESAARVLGNLAADSEPNKADIVAAGAVPALLRLLRHDSGDRVPSTAAATLRSLAAGGGPIQAAIVAAGAVPALVPLLSQQDHSSMYAAAALNHLASGSEANRAAILAAGAAPLLVQLLDPTTFLGLKWAAADALLSLAGGSSGGPTPKLLDPVAAASAVPALVRLLGQKDAPYSLASIAASVVPAPDGLLGLKEAYSGTVRKAAAAVLLNLGQSSEAGMAASPVVQPGGSRVPTVTAGTATALVQLLGWCNSAVRHVAAVVLGDLARFSEANRAAAVAAGAVPALEQQLRSHSGSSSVHRAAASAVASLAASRRASRGTEQAAPEQLQRPRISSQTTDIDTAQLRRQPAKATAAPSAPPATASLLGAGPSAPPATASLLAMLQPTAPSQSGAGAALVTQAAGTHDEAPKAAGASMISSVAATLGSFLGLGSRPTAPTPSPVSIPGSSSGAPPPPTPLTAGFNCRTVPFSELNLQRRLGSGSFGTVLLATLEETPVAAKVLVKLKDGPSGFEVADALTKQQLEKVQRECSLLASISHPNIVQFLCACEWPPTIVTEYCARGSLLDVLKAARQSPQHAALLSWARRLGMALDAARGILHMHNRGIAHRDLKSPNLLVDAGWRVKVADFGFSKLLDGDRHGVMSSTMNGVNPKWQAPEVLRCEPATSPAALFASDAYAFGCVMWELMTWDVPWGGESTYRIMYLKMNGGHLDIPSTPKSLAQLPGTDRDKAAFQGVAARYTQLIKQCWAANHLDRPKFASIAQQLKEIQRELCAAA